MLLEQRVHQDLAKARRDFEVQKGLAPSPNINNNLSGSFSAATQATNYQNHRSLNVVGSNAGNVGNSPGAGQESLSGLLGGGANPSGGGGLGKMQHSPIKPVVHVVHNE